jgi:hypothetical protein
LEKWDLNYQVVKNLVFLLQEHFTKKILKFF